MDFVTLYSTWPDAESAAKAARTLVESRLIACANIIPACQSIFIWEDEVFETAESILLAKTTKNAAPAAVAALCALHTYSVPCIVATPIDVDLSHAGFFNWIAESVKLASKAE